MSSDSHRPPSGTTRLIPLALFTFASTCLVLPATERKAVGQYDYQSQLALQQQAAVQGQVGADGAEILTYGPIHEAFANPSELDPVQPPVIDQPPPPAVPEEPAEYKPEGDYIWIPGYWMWDDEREDFIWISGVWRQSPPSMQWVTGYWIEANGGWQRIPGFWTSVETTEVQYYEPPPETLDIGPASPAPDDNHFWVPGTWVYQDAGYRWRAGYWSPYQPNWIWYPARWVWTPAGCIYQPGFWDYRLAVRGQCFAPVYFHRSVFLQPRWVYRPWCVIPPDTLFVHLWLRPGFGHYYFGNFYGPRYAALGFHPWAVFPARRSFYDPLYTYANVHYRRHGIDFVGRVRGWHEFYDRTPDLRPPRTWRDHTQFVARARTDERFADRVGQAIIARDIREVARRDDFPVQLTRLDSRARERLVERASRLRELDDVRRRTESQAARIVTRGERTPEVQRELQSVTRDFREALRVSRQDARDDARDVTRGPFPDAAREARSDARETARDRFEDRRLEGRADRPDREDIADRIRDARERREADLDRSDAEPGADLTERRGDRPGRPGRTPDEAADDLAQSPEVEDPTARIRERMPDEAGELLQRRPRTADRGPGFDPRRRDEEPGGRGRLDPSRGAREIAEDRLPGIDRQRGVGRTEPTAPDVDVDRTPGIGRQPGFDRTPGIGRQPGLDRTPGIGRQPGLDRGPGVERGPLLDRAEAVERARTVDPAETVERARTLDPATIDRLRGPQRGPRVERTPGIDAEPSVPGVDRTPGLAGPPGLERGPGRQGQREALRPSVPEETPLVTPERRPDALTPPAVRPSLDSPRIESVDPREVPYPRGKAGRPAVTPQLETPRGAAPRPAPRMNLPSTDVPSPRLEAPGASPPVATPRDLSRPRPVTEAPAPSIEREGRAIERPGPTIERRSQTPTFERLGPAVERRGASPAVERPAPQIERRIEQPTIERAAPRVERSAPAPRVERPAPRVERSAPTPRASAERGRSSDRNGGPPSNRGKGRDRD